MKILILTDIFPTPAVPHAACFLTERLKIYNKEGVYFDVYSLIVRESIPLKFLNKLRGAKLPDYGTKVNYDTIDYNFIYLKQGLFDRLFLRGKYLDMMKKAITDNLPVKSYDLILVHFIYPLAIVAKEISDEYGIPYFLIAQGSDIHTHPSLNPKVLPIFLDAIEGASTAIFVSQGLLNKAISVGYSGKNATVIPNGVNLSRFIAIPKKHAKEAIGIPVDRKCVGFLGNLLPVKGADRLVEIFSSIQKQAEKPLHFMIIGDGSLRDSISEEALSKNVKVDMRGYVPQMELNKFMSAMDVMIVPSRNEGWPCVILEANACGTPVVGSDNGGIPEAIGDHNLVIPDGYDFERRFAGKVVSVLSSPPNQDKLSSQAKQFAWDITAGKEIELYEQVLSSLSIRNLA